MHGWSIQETPNNSIVFKVLPAGTLIEGDEDDESEDWEVPEGQVALVVSGRWIYKLLNGEERVSTGDMFFVHGTPKEIWNFLGKAQQALPLE